MFNRPDSILNLYALSESKTHDTPFWWAYHDFAFTSPTAAAALQAEFPTMGYKHFKRGQGSKKHDLRGLILDEHHPTPISRIWAKLHAELRGAEYRRALASLSGVSLEGLQTEITLWRQNRGGYIDPHPDNASKVLIHLLYFSRQEWGPEDGGCLRILRSNSIDDVAAEVPPRLGSSVIFRRSDSSWHGYKPVISDVSPRLGVQIVFHDSSLEYGKTGSEDK